MAVGKRSCSRAHAREIHADLDTPEPKFGTTPSAMLR